MHRFFLRKRCDPLVKITNPQCTTAPHLMVQKWAGRRKHLTHNDHKRRGWEGLHAYESVHVCVWVGVHVCARVCKAQWGKLEQYLWCFPLSVCKHFPCHVLSLKTKVTSDFFVVMKDRIIHARLLPLKIHTHTRATSSVRLSRFGISLGFFALVTASLKTLRLIIQLHSSQTAHTIRNLVFKSYFTHSKLCHV